jgi:hypothetical protein
LLQNAEDAAALRHGQRVSVVSGRAAEAIAGDLIEGLFARAGIFVSHGVARRRATRLEPIPFVCRMALYDAEWQDFVAYVNRSLSSLSLCNP